jgi:SLT domain-containing protein
MTTLATRHTQDTTTGYPLNAGQLHDFRNIARHHVVVAEAEARSRDGLKRPQ